MRSFGSTTNLSKEKYHNKILHKAGILGILNYSDELSDISGDNPVQS